MADMPCIEPHWSQNVTNVNDKFFPSEMNIHSINLLKYSAFAGGIVYGYTHLQTLTHFVQQRSILQEKQHYADLVEEAKLSYDTHKTRELSKLAKADNSICY